MAAFLWWGLPAAAQDFSAATNKLADGGFEGPAPSYWAPSGAGATWATDRAHSGTHSIQLSGAGAASWTQGEVVRNWVDRIAATTAFSVRAWVYTENVNTAPSGDDAKFQIVLTFRDAGGADILGAPVVLDLPQASATTGGWVQVLTAPQGEIILPVDARSVTAVVRKGSAASGTVWVDDFGFIGGNGDPITSWHGANVDFTGDWYTYWPGFDGSRATPTWVVGKTTAESHTGAASLRVERLGAPLPGEEAVSISERVPVTPGRPVLVSYWVKTDGNADPATIGQGDNNIGLTALWYSSLQSGAAGYNEIGGADIRLNGEYNSQVIPLLPRQAANGWTNYAFVLNPIANTAAMEVRLRYWHTFTGVTHWDDIALTNIAGANLFGVAGEAPAPGSPAGPAASRWLQANAPNPFAASTEIRFVLPQAEDVTVEVYDLVGRRVALLADGVAMPAGDQTLTFERGDLSSGTYLVVLRTPSHSEAQQVTVVR